MTSGFIGERSDVGLLKDESDHGIRGGQRRSSLKWSRKTSSKQVTSVLLAFYPGLLLSAPSLRWSRQTNKGGAGSFAAFDILPGQIPVTRPLGVAHENTQAEAADLVGHGVIRGHPRSGPRDAFAENLVCERVFQIRVSHPGSTRHSPR
jgi:hypothetical protein